jgi:hypothetical protein
MAAGALTIIAAGICAFLGISFTAGTINPPPSKPEPGEPIPNYRLTYGPIGAFGLLGLAGGLKAVVMIFRRKRVYLAMIGIALMIPESFAIHLLKSSAEVWGFGTAILVLSFLGIFFTAMSRREFTS